jgi:predicted ATPase
MEETLLQTALERLAEADILLVQGLPPEADYRFKHALILDVAYENLLKSRRQILHRRVAGALRDNITASATPEPELLAHHFKQAGMPAAAIEWWGKAAQRSLERSALIEAIAQFTRALDHIATLPPTPALRREQINFQVALITPLVHVKGYAASETRAAVERAHVLIEQAQALGEPPDDPLLLFSVLYGFWAANINGDVALDLATQFLTLAEKERMTTVQPHAHHCMGVSLLETGDIAGGRAHFDPAQHRLLATRFGQMRECRRFPVGRRPRGSLAIPTLRSQMLSERLAMRASSAKSPRC